LGTAFADALFDGPAQRQALLDPAREVGDLAVAGGRVHVVARTLDEVAVVADGHERPRARRSAVSVSMSTHVDGFPGQLDGNLMRFCTAGR
jgi:hypothetical protein